MGIRGLIVLTLISTVAPSKEQINTSKAIHTFNTHLTFKESNYMARKILSYSAANDVDPSLICAIIAVESGFKPTAKGSIGEVGLMQLRPEFHALHISDVAIRTAYLFDIQMNLLHGIKYVSHLKESYGSRYPGFKWVEKYNLGPHKIPTKFKYTKKVMQYYAKFKGV